MAERLAIPLNKFPSKRYQLRIPIEIQALFPSSVSQGQRVAHTTRVGFNRIQEPGSPLNLRRSGSTLGVADQADLAR